MKISVYCLFPELCCRFRRRLCCLPKSRFRLWRCLLGYRCCLFAWWGRSVPSALMVMLPDQKKGAEAAVTSRKEAASTKISDAMRINKTETPKDFPIKSLIFSFSPNCFSECFQNKRVFVNNSWLSSRQLVNFLDWGVRHLAGRLVLTGFESLPGHQLQKSGIPKKGKTCWTDTRQCRQHSVNMERRKAPVTKSQRSNNFKLQTKKATQSLPCLGGKSQLFLFFHSQKLIDPTFSICHQ